MQNNGQHNGQQNREPLIRLSELAKGDEAASLGRKQVAREVYLANETERLTA